MFSVKKAFTLMEIIVSVTVLAILSTIGFVLINLAELRQQGADNQRVVDLTDLNLAVADFNFNYGGEMGSQGVVYISLPDENQDCSSYSLPDLAAGWSYQCRPKSGYQKTDGSGWLPIDLSGIESRLAVDSLNTGQYFYAYVVSPATKTWVLSAIMQSEKFLKSFAVKDGGFDDSRFEIGTGLGLWAGPAGISGYWKMDSLVAGETVDLMGNHDAIVSGANLVSGKLGSAFSFDGLNDYLRIDNLVVATSSGMFNTVEFWMNWFGQDEQLVIGWNAPYALSFDYGCLGFNVGQGSLIGIPSSNLANQWLHLAVVFYNGVPAIENSKIYLNGRQQNLSSCHGSVTPAKNATETMFVGDWGTGGGNNFSGLIDNLKVYSRELSEAEIMSLYWASR